MTNRQNILELQKGDITKVTVDAIVNAANLERRTKKEKLADCYQNSLKLAADNNCKTIAFPNISTGIYKFPKNEAAKIAVQT